jgi:hypothetical protein
MNEFNKITRTYDIISDMKKNKVTEAADNYSNVDFKDNVVGNSTPSKDNINISLLQDVQTAAKNANLKVDITTAISGHSPGSRHDSGNAVDIAIINGKAVSLNNREDADKLVNELIKLGYTKNSESGNDKAVLTFGFKGHDNHVHVSKKSTTPSSPSSDDSSETDTESSSSSEGGYLSSIAGNMAKSIVGKDSKGEYNTFNVLDMVGLKENIDRIKELLK